MNFKRFGRTANLFDYQTMSDGESGKYLLPDGSTAASVGVWAITDYIPINGTTFTLIRTSSGNAPAICLYDINKNYLTGIAYSGNMTVTVSSSNNAKFARFSYLISTVNPENLSEAMLVEGSTAPSSYIPYGSAWTDILHYIHNTSTDTLTTLPAVLYPNAVTATVGLKGNMEQSGTPTPINPIQPSECGERTGQLINPLTATYGKYIDNNGVEQRSSTGYSNHSDYIRIEAGETYTLSYSKPQIGSHTAAIAWYTENKTFIIRSYEPMPTGEGRYLFTTQAPNNAAYAISNFSYFEAYTQEQNENNYILSKGSELLPYEPYGYKIPILSNSTTTNVYLGEVESTRQIKKLVFDGTEEWRSQYGGYVLSVTKQSGLYTVLSTHYIAAVSASIDKSIYGNSTNVIIIFDSDYSTLDDFKTYLAQQYAAGTPVCVWYVLATPTTGIVNEPIRKIGGYADEVSGITIPTIAGANTISVDTTLQPSEVSVNYHGWHPVSAVHERENGQWD